MLMRENKNVLPFLYEDLEMFDKHDEREEREPKFSADFSKEVSACFESMLFPKGYFCQGLNLAVDGTEPRAKDYGRPSGNWFDYPTPAASRTISSRSSSGSDKTCMEFSDDSDDSIVLKDKFRDFSIGNSPVKPRSNSLNSFQREIQLPRRLSFEKNVFSFKATEEVKWGVSAPWDVSFRTNDTVWEESHSARYDKSMESNMLIGKAGLEQKVVQFTKTQKGCRFLQKILQEGTNEQCKTILEEISPIYAEIIEDPFGNYVAQKLYEISSYEDRKFLLSLLSKDIRGIANNNHGTRALQKIIECSQSQEYLLDDLLFSFHNSIYELSTDANGNHVIQKLLSCIKFPHNQVFLL